jgi:hypothetical protein
MHANRRTFLCHAGATVGTAALAALLNPSLLGGASPQPLGINDPNGRTIGPHHPARARRIIQLYMAGGPSQLETFDHKPMLRRLDGQPMPDSITKGQPVANLPTTGQTCFGPQWPFKRVGKAGHEVCDILPRLQEVADELCIIRSMRTEAINHDPANTYMNTGSLISGRPAFGSWVTYGLGSESSDLPGFIVLSSLGKFGIVQPLSARQWHSGFLPGRFQGVPLRSTGDPVLYLNRPPGVQTSQQRDLVETVRQLNQLRDGPAGDPELVARIAQYELAFRMQSSVPSLMDMSDEPRSVFSLYGCKPADGSFASNCLLARRLAQRGVRFIQLYHREWDHHVSIKEDVAGTAAEVDQGMAALIKDLRRLDMLKDTLVLWNGEFGRSPTAQGLGRDHHQQGFSVWMAGGGIKAGLCHGATDEFGYHAVEDVVHVNDLHATVLHLLGIDHRRLTFMFQGRDFRITDAGGAVVKSILA